MIVGAVGLLLGGWAASSQGRLRSLAQGFTPLWAGITLGLLTSTLWVAIATTSLFTLSIFARWVRAIRRLRIPAHSREAPCCLFDPELLAPIRAVAAPLEEAGFEFVSDLLTERLGRETLQRLLYHRGEAITALIFPSPPQPLLCLVTQTAHGEDWTTHEQTPLYNIEPTPPHVRLNPVAPPSTPMTLLEQHRAFTRGISPAPVPDLEAQMFVLQREAALILEGHLRRGWFREAPEGPDQLRITWIGILHLMRQFLHRPVRFS